VITFGGLATGLDTQQIIDQLVKVESQPLRRLSTKQAQIDARSQKITTLRTRLEELRTAALGLDTRAEALPAKASSSQESVVRAEARPGATSGRFAVEVLGLASAARVYSDPVASRTDPGGFGVGTLALEIGGARYEIALDGTESLDEVAAAVQASGAPVSTSVLREAGGYRLQVSGQDTGAANALTVDEGALTLGLARASNVVSVAEDARLRIDGFEVTSPTNTVTDVVPSVTLELISTSPGTTQRVEVSQDGDALATSLQKLVDAYNAVNSLIATEASWSGTAKGASSLNGDATLRTLQSRMRQAVLAPVAGTTGRYTTLASIGVSFDRTGALSLSRAKLDEALSRDPEGVARVLAGSGGGSMSAVATTIDGYSSPTNGVLKQRLDAMGRERAVIQTRMDAIQLRIDKTEMLLRQQFATLEKTVSALQGQGNQISAALSALER
jgi:flagellar hook-associated protein 2